jgi:subtilisin family serine protease
VKTPQVDDPTYTKPMSGVSSAFQTIPHSTRAGDARFTPVEHNTRRHMRGTGSLKRFVAAAIAAVFVVSSLGTAWSVRASAFTSHVDPSLRAGEVALVHTMPGLAGALSSKLAELGATDIQTEYAADTVIARLSSEALDFVRRDGSVTVATSDTTVVALDSDWSSNTSNVSSAGIYAINAPYAWSTTKGAGVTVALMDSGIAQHPDLRDNKVLARVDFVRDGSTLLDPAGHGTHLAGLIAANGDDFRGVAPDAKLVSVRVLGANGSGSLTSIVQGFDWVLWNAKRFGITVLNLSWGAPQATSYHQDLLAALAESAWFSGIAVVAAAGNGGSGTGTVTMPGADPFVITAGSFEDMGTTSVGDDRPSTFSSGDLTLDGFTKPDVLAPGHYVVSLRATGVAYPGGLIGERYVRMTGTSASAAFVSGVAALVRAANPAYTPTQAKGAVVASGRRIANTTARVVDAPRALTSMTTVNAQLAPSRVLVSFLSKSGLLAAGTTWEGVTWEGVTWETVTWESVSWESVSWEGVTWESTTWEGATWERTRGR